MLRFQLAEGRCDRQRGRNIIPPPPSGGNLQGLGNARANRRFDLTGERKARNSWLYHDNYEIDTRARTRVPETRVPPSPRGGSECGEGDWRRDIT